MNYILSFIFIIVFLPVLKTLYYNFFWGELYPFIWQRIFYKRHEETLKLFEELFNSKNLKSTYRFIDHASKTENNYHEDYEDYKDNEPSIFLDEEKSLHLYDKSTDYIVELLNNSKTILSIGNHLTFWIYFFDKDIRENYNDIQLKQTCFGVSYIMHNRNQRKEKDEAHWFIIKTFEMDLYTRLLLNNLSFISTNNFQDNYNQPKNINQSYPFITKCNFCCNVFYKNEENKSIESYCSYNYKEFCITFFLDFCLDDLNTNQMSLKDIKNEIKRRAMEQFISVNHVNNIENCYLTDIGISNGEISIFAEIWVLEKPKEVSFPMINQNKLLTKGIHKFSDKLYYSLSNSFIRNNYE